jgi:hypothetical protein
MQTRSYYKRKRREKKSSKRETECTADVKSTVGNAKID